MSVLKLRGFFVHSLIFLMKIAKMDANVLKLSSEELLRSGDEVPSLQSMQLFSVTCSAYLCLTEVLPPPQILCSWWW